MTNLRFVLSSSVIALALLLGTAVPSHGQSLYTDPVAREPGDVLTIVLDEQTSAQRESSYEGSSNSSIGGSGSASGPGLNGQFGADAEISSETNNGNQSTQSGMLTGTMTVRVVEVNQAGNLLVKGTRNLTVNGATHVMKVNGTVRASDIRFDNSVLSHQIANAEIKYNQSGVRHNGFFSKGLLLKAGSVAAIGVGIFLGFN